MTTGAPTPTEIRRLGMQGVRITWSDGHCSELPNQYLRDHCPCAECRARPRHQLPVVGNARQLQPTEIRLVGRYAVGVTWSDGHDAGIYRYETLRRLCPCATCAAGPSVAPEP